ncbi:hypothetical protein P1P75_09820 [Streptomyces sp. ID05-39B]|uniref:hypothetical protein n=1 Tax=Streptomyces sp. ID05-39B TaxID=3028664 RepID=UPI0029AF81C1|nr:hypothetical protein [Streptomyces sp. ID05-39B]MDX3526733.1 hypothetical protein [Streptomyces sp. ID05-39B]
MASLWRVRVTRVSDNTVELTLSAIHPDAGEPSASAAFAMRLLADTDPERLDREAGPGAYWDPVALAEYADRVIAAVSVTARRRMPFDEDAARRAVEAELRARGLDPADATAWQAAFLDAWRALWQDPDRVPSAVLEIRSADLSWLAGTIQGREWDTAAYG